MLSLVVPVLLIALGVAATPVTAAEVGKVHRVAFIGFHSPGLENRLIASFQERLAELGYVEGRDLSITFRWADGQLSNYPAIAADVVSASVDVIVSPCGPIVGAIRKLDATVPLVVRSVDVKTCEGEIDTLDRPGGYTTGAIYFSPGATRRRLELLRELVPGLSHVGILHRPRSEWTEHWPDVEAVAAEMGLRLHRAPWNAPTELPRALDGAVNQGVGALLTLGDGATFYHRHQIFALAAERKIPVLYDFSLPPAGFDLGLMSYSVDVRTLFRLVAEQVDQILRGTKPGAIPVARPQQFRLLINRDVARVLGLAIPGTLLLRHGTIESLEGSRQERSRRVEGAPAPEPY